MLCPATSWGLCHPPSTQAALRVPEPTASQDIRVQQRTQVLAPHTSHRSSTWDPQGPAARDSQTWLHSLVGAQGPRNTRVLQHAMAGPGQPTSSPVLALGPLSPLAGDPRTWTGLLVDWHYPWGPASPPSRWEPVLGSPRPQPHPPACGHKA